jgi:hypothetical protein
VIIGDVTRPDTLRGAVSGVDAILFTLGSDGLGKVGAETLSAASAILVAAHNALPLVAHWGAGEVASADGMRSSLLHPPFMPGPIPNTTVKGAA